jgi:hypothetical protein
MTMSTTDRTQIKTYWQISAFWLPLGIMWLMMAAEQPLLTAAIARMDDQAINLAAFGVVFAIALVIESPVIQMLSAGTALAGNRWDYRMLMKLMHLLAISLTVIHAIVAFTPLYDLIVGTVLNVPEPVLEASRAPFAAMTPFTAAVGYRRLWQGTLIRHGKSWIVPISMITRIVAVAAILLVGLRFLDLPGAMLAAVGLSGGVIVAAGAAGVMYWRLVAPNMADPEADEPRLGWHSLLEFYVPLSLTTVIFLAARPMVTFGIARSQQPELSLAVWPVLNAFLFLFNSLALSYQEASIALLKQNRHNLKRLSRFTGGLALSLSAVMLAISLSPLRTMWFASVSGLTADLLALVPMPLLLLSLVPALVALRSFSRARYVAGSRTRVLTLGGVVFTIVLFSIVFVGPFVVSVNGAILAALAMVIANAVENGYLLLRNPDKLL